MKVEKERMDLELQLNDVVKNKLILQEEKLMLENQKKEHEK